MNGLNTLKVLPNGSAKVRALVLHTREEPVSNTHRGKEYLTEAFLKNIHDRYNKTYKSFLNIGKGRFPKVMYEHQTDDVSPLLARKEVVGRLDSKMEMKEVFIKGKKEWALFVELYITEPSIVAMVENGELYHVSVELYQDKDGYFADAVALTKKGALGDAAVLLSSDTQEESQDLSGIAKEIVSVALAVDERCKKKETSKEKIATRAVLLSAVRQNKLTRADADRLFDKCAMIDNNVLNEIFKCVAPIKSNRSTLFSSRMLDEPKGEEE